MLCCAVTFLENVFLHIFYHVYVQAFVHLSGITLLKVGDHNGPNFQDNMSLLYILSIALKKPLTDQIYHYKELILLVVMRPSVHYT